MRNPSFLLVALLPLVPLAAAVAELTDLGQGLAYLRIHSLADSEPALRAALPGTGALVLDLRYATASDEAIAGLRADLAVRPAGATLFILVSPATPPGVAQVVNRSPVPVLTLGAPGSVPAPKVVVKIAAVEDRRAYDALEAGTPVDLLVSGKIEKKRFDEATLVQEFKNGIPDPGPPALPALGRLGGPSPDPTAPTPPNAVEKIPPPVDRVLQRAVHLHRALVALRRPGTQS